MSLFGIKYVLITWRMMTQAIPTENVVDNLLQNLHSYLHMDPKANSQVSDLRLVKSKVLVELSHRLLKVWNH